MRPIPYLDTAWAEQLVQFCTDAYADQITQIDAAHGQSGQIEYVFATDYALDAALVSYALGASLADVRVWIARAAVALAEIFRLRGTAPIFPIESVTEGESVPAGSPDACDFSLTNSRRGLLAMYLALAADNMSLAEEIAALVGDPPEASYIGSDSKVCTPDEQQLAYALKFLLLGQDAVAAFYAVGVGYERLSLRHQAAAVKALVGRDPSAFLSALHDLLMTHIANANNKINAHEPHCLMCLPCLGLAALALKRLLVEVSELPCDNVYLPHDLLQCGQPE